MVPDRPLYDRPLAERPRLVKLGVKPGQRISVLGIDEPGFADELASAGADVSTRVRRDSDMIFLAANDPADLERVGDLRPYIRPNGAIWVVRRKGKGAALKDVDVIEAGRAARMVDNKIVSFNDASGAMRLVIRLVDR
jgi:hypothetical protein